MLVSYLSYYYFILWYDEIEHLKTINFYTIYSSCQGVGGYRVLSTIQRSGMYLLSQYIND